MQDNSANNRRIAKNTLFLYIRMFFVLGISLYTSRAILKVLGENEFGVYNVVAGFVTMFAFLNTSLSSCIQRFFNYEHGKDGDFGVGKVYSAAVIIQIVIAIIVCLAVETVGVWFLNNKLVIPPDSMDAARLLFHMSVISMMFVILQAPFLSAVMAYEKMNYYAVVGIIDILLKLIIVLIIPLVPYDHLSSYGVLLALESLFILLLYVGYCKIQFPFLKLDFSIGIPKIKEIISFSGWSILGSFALVVRNQGLNILLNMFFGPVVNAARGLSFQVKSAVVSFTASISTASRPQMVESYAIGNYARSTNLLITISRICFVLLYTIILPLASEIEFVLNIWLGPDVPENTAIFTVLILLVALIDSFNGHTSTIIYASGRIAWYNIITSFMGVCVIPLSYCMLKVVHNPLIVYVSSIFISISILIISTIFQGKLAHVSIRVYLQKVLLPSILLLIMTFWVPLIIRATLPYGLMRFCINVPVSALIVILTSYIVVFDNKERTMVKNIVCKVCKR